MPTITDIAKACGTSKTTVSKILNGGDHRISRATRDKVMDTMRRLDYRPSALARGLSKQRSGMIGVVTPLGVGVLSKSYYATIIGAILDEAIRSGQTMALFNEHVWRDEAHTELVFSDGRCDGLIVIDATPLVGLVPALHKARIPFIAINSGYWIPDTFCIDMDNKAVGKDLTNYLIGRGHRSIVYMHANEAMQSSMPRFEGYKEALLDANIPFDDKLVLSNAHGSETGYTMAQALISGTQCRPTAILCGTDTIALSAILGLRDMGVRVPDDISVAGINGVPDGAHSYPPLTTMSQSLESLGTEATKLLLEAINNPGMKPRHVVWDAKLIERGSVASPPNC